MIEYSWFLVDCASNRRFYWVPSGSLTAHSWHRHVITAAWRDWTKADVSFSLSGSCGGRQIFYRRIFSKRKLKPSVSVPCSNYITLSEYKALKLQKTIVELFWFNFALPPPHIARLQVDSTEEHINCVLRWCTLYVIARVNFFLYLTFLEHVFTQHIFYRYFLWWQCIVLMYKHANKQPLGRWCSLFLTNC